MMYFGEPWPSSICETGRQVPAPVGDTCFSCDEKIGPGEQGVVMHTEQGARPVHKECSLREVLGGIGHIENHARWCVEEHDPDGGRSRRQSALDVWEWVQRHGQPVGGGDAA